MYEFLLVLGCFSPCIALFVSFRVVRWFEKRSSDRMYRGFMGIPKKHK